MINAGKSSFYFAPSLAPARVTSIAAHLGFNAGKVPITYLGCPLYYGRKTKQLYDPLVLKLKNKINTWLSKFLNLAGRVTLISQILHSMTSYQIASLNPPSAVIKLIESLFVKFILGTI